jgi:hypothetical protein
MTFWLELTSAPRPLALATEEPFEVANTGIELTHVAEATGNQPKRERIQLKMTYGGKVYDNTRERTGRTYAGRR